MYQWEKKLISESVDNADFVLSTIKKIFCPNSSRIFLNLFLQGSLTWQTSDVSKSQKDSTAMLFLVPQISSMLNVDMSLHAHDTRGRWHHLMVK